MLELKRMVEVWPLGIACRYVLKPLSRWVCPAPQGISDVMHSVGPKRWGCPMPETPAGNALLDARMHDARHLVRLDGECVLLFAPLLS